MKKAKRTLKTAQQIRDEILAEKDALTEAKRRNRSLRNDLKITSHMASDTARDITRGERAIKRAKKKIERLKSSLPRAVKRDKAAKKRAKKAA